MPTAALIDVRAPGDFLKAHASGAANISLEDLPHRVHELPSREVALRVTDADPARAAEHLAALRGLPIDPRLAEQADRALEVIRKEPLTEPVAYDCVTTDTSELAPMSPPPTKPVRLLGETSRLV